MTARTVPNRGQLAGRLDSRDRALARRRMTSWIVLGAVLLAAYSVPLFMRILQVTSRLPGWPRGFPVAAAVLFTLLSASAMYLLVWWAAKKSRLRDALTAVTAISTESHGKVDRFTQMSEGFQVQSKSLSDASTGYLADAEAERQLGAEQVVRAAQKSGSLLGIADLVLPDETNLGNYQLVERDKALDYLEMAYGNRLEAELARTIEPDFSTTDPLPNPWLIRTGDSFAAPDIELVDDARLPGARAARRRRRSLAG